MRFLSVNREEPDQKLCFFVANYLGDGNGEIYFRSQKVQFTREYMKDHTCIGTADKDMRTRLIIPAIHTILKSSREINA